MSRKYTVINEGDSKEYFGFNRNYNPVEMDLIAVISVEGDLETFVLEDTKRARLSFVEFLADSEQYSSATIIGVFRRE